MSRRRVVLQPNIIITAAAFTAASGTINGLDVQLGTEHVQRMLMILDVTAHDNTDANETYDVRVESGFKMPNGDIVRWDIGCFTQVSGANAAVYQAMFVSGGQQQPTSNIADGTVTKMTSILSAATLKVGGTLTAAFARHGYFGDFLRYVIVGAGTTPGPITFEVAGFVWT